VQEDQGAQEAETGLGSGEDGTPERGGATAEGSQQGAAGSGHIQGRWISILVFCGELFSAIVEWRQNNFYAPSGS